MNMNACLLAALCGGVASAQTAQFVDFNSDAEGGVPVGFVSDDSPLVSFGGTGGSALSIVDFGTGKSDQRSLFLPSDTTEGIRMSFSRVISSITLEMGNDDGGFVGGTVYTTLRGWLNGTPVASVVFQNNSDNTINDGPSLFGAFDRVEVFYTDAAGSPIGLAEIIDNISFCVADEFIDFNSDPAGAFPVGSRSDDSALVAFGGTNGANLQIVDFFTGKSDARSLFIPFDSTEGIRMNFARPVGGVSVQMGNDDGGFVGGTVYTTLRGFYQGQAAGSITYQNNSNNTMDDGPGLSGVFDRVEVYYTNAAGVPINLAEIIDNISVATLSQVIDFEADAGGSVPNGFESADSPIVRFSDTNGSDLAVEDFFTGKSDGQSLVCFSDDPSSVRMEFNAPICCLTLEYGNDQPGFGSFATLRGYRNGVLTRTVTIPTLSDDLLNESISIAGDFDAVEFQYTNAAGDSINLIEIIDNIRFAVKKQLIDFNDDVEGGVPNGFVSNDSALVSFRDSIGADLAVFEGGGKTEGRGLFVFSDDASTLRMDFVTPANTLTVEFGNDDGAFVGGPIYATLRTFVGTSPRSSTTVLTNGNDLLDESVSASGFFNRAEFFYSDAAGSPIGLIEAVDNICFDVATGALPCGLADLAEPFGILDLSDVTAFISAFTTGGPAADLDGNGLFDLSDISAFVSAFIGGCP